jgi:hypothetical protein
MSQQLGASRMTTQFSAGSFADEKLQEMLTLYKAPAAIRDMKQVFFYVDANANTTSLDPLILQYNVPTALGLPTTSTYYAGLGTSRSFNIADKVNELLDIRVPKDKYVIEINLAECVIEADPEGWENIPDRVIARNLNVSTGAWGAKPTYKLKNSLAAPDGSDPQREVLLTDVRQTTKVSKPQTLYCKIRQLDNGQPYNWAVTNSGAYSIDKSHQLLVRHGDIDQAQLDLEFGHLAFEGNNAQVANELVNTPSQLYRDQNIIQTEQRTDPLPDNQQYYRNYKYVDYNSEVYNTITTKIVGSGDTNFQDDLVANFYKGDGGVDGTVNTQYDSGTDYKTVPGKNLEQPTNRPPYYYAKDYADPVFLQGQPLFYNQQAARLGFRFLIRIIHLF